MAHRSVDRACGAIQDAAHRHMFEEGMLPGECHVHCAKPGHIGIAGRRECNRRRDPAEALKLGCGEESVLNEHLPRWRGVVRVGVVVVRDIGVEVSCIDLAPETSDVSTWQQIARRTVAIEIRAEDLPRQSGDWHGEMNRQGRIEVRYGADLQA